MERMGAVIYCERDLYLGCDRSSGHRTKMGKGPDGSDGGCECCVIRFRFTKRRGKGTKRAREPGRGSNQIGSCVSFRAAGSRVRAPCQSVPVSYVFFFFYICIYICIAGAYPVWHPTTTHPTQSILQGRRTAVNEKTPWGKKRLVCAPGTWPSTCPDPFLDRNRSLTISTAIVQSRYLVELAAAYIHTNPDSVNRIWRRVSTLANRPVQGSPNLSPALG